MRASTCGSWRRSCRPARSAWCGARTARCRPSRRAWSSSPERSPSTCASYRSRPDMRIVLVGPGAVGGVVGGRLFQFGHDVVLVARGAHRDAIAAGGLTVEWPEGSVTLPVPVVGSPAELTFGPDDVVVVAVKSQDTSGVIESLAAVAPPSTPIVCLQNGVANEVAFLRRFANVHGVTVMAPTWHLEPGVVRAYTHDAAAILDVGRWPGGVDDVTEAVAAAFRSARFESEARPDIPRWKYTKLLLNLTNPIDALCPRDEDFRTLSKLATRRARPCCRPPGSTTSPPPRTRPAAATSCASSRSTPRPGRGPRRGRAWPAACRWRSITSPARSSC